MTDIVPIVHVVDDDASVRTALTRLLRAAGHAVRAWPSASDFLTGHGDVATGVRAMKAGAVDFLTKPVERETLLAAVAHALARDSANHTVHEELLTLQQRYASLTPREREVFARVTAGNPNKQIAAEIGAAERTVKLHRARVMEKMHANSLAELVRAADRLNATSFPQFIRPC
jgi:FixJ family two-component response regulator